MRYAALLLVLFAVGCGGAPDPTVPAQTSPQMLGGLSDARPFFGRVSKAISPSQEVGDFALASCGCGSWRAVVLSDDGHEHTQVDVQFRTADGTEVLTPSSTVVFSGERSGIAIEGTVNQASGTATGRMRIVQDELVFSAVRSEAHTARTSTCLMCHTGDDPLWPLPSWHPVYQKNPPNCLICHPVGMGT